MTRSEFNKCIRWLFENCETTLVIKGKEYAPNRDRLDHFKKAAALLRSTPEKALLGQLTKHLVSIIDMVETPDKYTEAKWIEKIGDSINYLALLYAVICEQIAQQPYTGGDIDEA